jgi:Na+/H+-dicarboxylate symporter
MRKSMGLKIISRMGLSSRIIAGLLLGIFTGLFFGEDSQIIQWIGEAWIRLMQMTVLPYVVVSLISGVGSLDASLAKKLAIRGGLLLLLFWLMAAIIIFAMTLTFPQWQDASFYSSNIVHESIPFNPIEIYIPSNPFYAMANSIVPAVVLFCIVFGVALIRHKDKALLVDAFRVFSDTLALVMNFMVQLTPLGVFSIAAVAAGTMTLDQLTHLEAYFIVYIVASLLLTFIVLPLFITMLTPFKYTDILSYSRSALLTGFIAQNIFIILPMLIESSKALFEKYDLNSEKAQHVVDVVIPVTFNFPNTGRLLALLFVPFTAWMSGSNLELIQYPEFLITGIFSLFAKAQIALPFLMDIFHIPHDLFNLYLPSAIINGKFDTMVSVMNLFAFSVIIASGFSGQLFFKHKKIFHAVTIMAVALALSVIFTRYFLFSIIDTRYTKDSLLMSMSMPGPVVNTIVYNKRPPAVTTTEIKQTTSGNNDLLDRIIQRGILRVGYRADRLPFTYFNNDYKLVGMDVNLLNHLAEELGVNLDFYPFEWDTFAEQLKNGELDIVPGVNYDTFNMINAELSTPYIDGQLGLVVKDFRRHDFASPETIQKLKTIKLAILGEPVFVKKTWQRVQALLPGVNIEVTPISTYSEFFALSDNEIDALLEATEIGSALTLLHPEYTTVIPKSSTLHFPMSFAIAKGEKDFALFLSHWLKAKKARGTIHDAHEYWVSGKGAQITEPRWSIRHNVLGW